MATGVVIENSTPTSRRTIGITTPYARPPNKRDKLGILKCKYQYRHKKLNRARLSYNRGRHQPTPHDR
jgi:hypothetical protein